MKTPILILLCTCFSFNMFSQSEDSLNSNYINVYLDGVYNFEEYIKVEIPYVNYMRNRFTADVHLMVASQTTGSGGRDYTLFFLGQNEFAGKNDTLHFFDNINNTEDESEKV